MKLNEGIKAIAEHYGERHQLMKLAEECSEFSAAFLKETNISYVYADAFLDVNIPRRDYFNKKRLAAEKETALELADVLVLTRQIEYFLSKNENWRKKIEGYMQKKVERQLKRMEEEPK